MIKNLSDGDVKESNDAFLMTQHEECDKTTEVLPDSCGMQIIGDVGGSWKVVMDAESNQCYYWNTVTGETSWVIPDGLVPEGVTSNGIGFFTVNGQVVYPASYTTDLASVSSQELVDPSALGSSHLSSIVPSEYPRTSVDDCHVSSAEEKLLTASCYETADAHSARLLQYGENLLQKMTVLECSLNGLEWVKKEIEMRMSDCKALSSYGSSLLPFWWHTESRLKELESSISKLETTCLLAYKNEKMKQQDGHPSTVIENEPLVNAGNTLTSPSNKSKIEACGRIGVNQNVKNEELSSGSSGEGLVCKKEAETVQPEVKSHIEDVDTDVDMEVDEETAPGVPGHTSSTECLQSEQALPSDFSLLECPPPSEECPPLPPDDEWIPPPPSETESGPPPPPPPKELTTLYSPPVVDTTLFYPEQSNLAYPLPAAEYYASVISEGTNVTYHVQAEGSHIIEHRPSSYNDAIAANPLSMPAEVAPVDASAFYSFPAGIPSAPVASSTEAAVYCITSEAISYDLPDTGSLGVSIQPRSNSLPNVKPDFSGSTISSKSEQGLLIEASATHVAQTLPSTSVVGGAAPSSTIWKGQTKVVRNKKRSVTVTSSLRSNKKVSSLVDKWKAAKEELHGEDDEEPESAYEALERKRQKGVEEWRAHQIATGEAQDNANFVPLGGDWRERVKLRIAGTSSETNNTPMLAIENDQTQPDVAELSKGLPSGWQAYLDESSKQVYYGNSITSETTWVRPQK